MKQFNMAWLVLFAIPTLALFVSGPGAWGAGNVNVKPEIDHPVCLKREYSDAHLREFPKQKLSALYVFVKTEKQKYEDGTSAVYSSAEVIGQKDGGMFANWEPTCEFKADGSANCFVECDGGSFQLHPRAADVVFEVSKDYYFPLFKSGTDRESATAEQTVSLEAKDPHNRAYKLFPAPASDCEAVKKRAKKSDHGC